jgi:hypothetical protein
MRDQLWRAVYERLCPLLTDEDVVLAPRGDWPAFLCRSTLYDELIELGDVTVLVLHKGLLPSLPKGELTRIAHEWQWVLANEVFVVLSRSGKLRSDIRRGRDIIHCMPVFRYLRSSSLKKRDAKIVYVHVPKTGGTSMWAALTRGFPSHVYYASIHAYLRNPPAPQEYDLIGLHFLPTDLRQLLSIASATTGCWPAPAARPTLRVPRS